MNLYLLFIIVGVIAFLFWLKSKKNHETDKVKITDHKNNRRQRNTATKFCGECGTLIDENTLFCSKCGTAVTDMSSSHSKKPPPPKKASK